MSKVSYVVAFRQVGALLGAGMGIYFLKESYWKTRITGALILITDRIGKIVSKEFMDLTVE